MSKTIISVKSTINASIETVWEKWNNPADITQWYFASDDWHCPAAANTLEEGASFNYRMEAKDGSFGFDFSGIYEKVIPFKLIRYGLEDGRKVEIEFSEIEGHTLVIETFDAEEINSVELQKGGWQAILDNFRKHVESQK